MPSNHLILCRPLLLPLSIFPSIRVFSNESVLQIRWPKCWSFSFTISPSNEYSGLISFRMDWLDLLAVQGTLKSLLQHHSQKDQFFSAQSSLWSNSHIHTRLLKTIALTMDFFGKVISLLFHMLSRLVIAFLPKSKHLLISWLQSPLAMILEPKKIKSATVSALPLSIGLVNVQPVGKECRRPCWGLKTTSPSPGRSGSLGDSGRLGGMGRGD